jgi:3,4-dihydroxy 2-butanone 4-phosphate synthase/GTP cyclohydrolase II
MDTVEANICLGFEPDERDYEVAAAILEDQGALSVRLLTNNPDKIDGLESRGIRVIERVALVTPFRRENAHYLETKARRMNHILGPTETN